MRTLVVAVALSLVACSGGGGGVDAGGLDGGADSGVDGGRPQLEDAGMNDAGTPDAGAPDAGAPDASTPDAGTPDAGVPDAGTPDAGTPDAGTPDAGTPDAGVPDAGTPDAGVTGFDPLVGIGTVTLVADGFEFTEGPTWRAAEGRLLFSDIPGDTIYQLDPPDTVTVFRRPSGNSNGLATDANGLLLAAEHGNRRVSRTLGDGTIVTVASEYEGKRLNSPNDIAVRSDGVIYFSDPPYGIDPSTEQELDFNGVFRVDLSGQLTAEWKGATSTRPNGVALSPDERTLYVSDSTAGITAFDVATDGSLSGARTFVPSLTEADGMAVDSGGNVFVATRPGVGVFAPDGTLWGGIDVPGGRVPTNCAFGGADRRTLYITADDALFRVSVVHPGIY